MQVVSCSAQGIKKASDAVRRGGIVVYPTETVYGIGCDPYNANAIERVIEIKMREKKPFPVLCSSLENAKKLVELHKEALKLAEKFWPGPLTIVAPIIDKKLPNILTFGSEMLGVRIPNHKCALKLIELSGGFLVGTSANRAGLKAPASAEEVKVVLSTDYDILLDGGETPLKVESTIIEVLDGKVTLLREKAISGEALGL